MDEGSVQLHHVLFLQMVEDSDHVILGDGAELFRLDHGFLLAEPVVAFQHEVSRDIQPLQAAGDKGHDKVLAVGIAHVVLHHDSRVVAVDDEVMRAVLLVSVDDLFPLMNHL